MIGAVERVVGLGAVICFLLAADLSLSALYCCWLLAALCPQYIRGCWLHFAPSTLEAAVGCWLHFTPQYIRGLLLAANRFHLLLFYINAH